MTELQVTVRSWDAEGGGSALTDAGAVVALPPDCLDGSPFRTLRSGQRLRVRCEGERVVQVGLV